MFAMRYFFFLKAGVSQNKHCCFLCVILSFLSPREAKNTNKQQRIKRKTTSPEVLQFLTKASVGEYSSNRGSVSCWKGVCGPSPLVPMASKPTRSQRCTASVYFPPCAADTGADIVYRVLKPTCGHFIVPSTQPLWSRDSALLKIMVPY